LSPAVEALLDRREQFSQGGKEFVVRGQTASQLPDSLDWSELRTVRRQEQQTEHSPIFPKQGFEKYNVVVSGVVQDYHHSLAVRAMP
jgi:hypothetical protein